MDVAAADGERLARPGGWSKLSVGTVPKRVRDRRRGVVSARASVTRLMPAAGSGEDVAVRTGRTGRLEDGLDVLRWNVTVCQPSGIGQVRRPLAPTARGVSVARCELSILVAADAGAVLVGPDPEPRALVAEDEALVDR